MLFVISIVYNIIVLFLEYIKMKKQLFLIIMTLLSMEVCADDSGSCGKNVTYTYVESTHTLTISGTGAMDNYELYSTVPWYSYRSEITKAIIEDSVTSIGDMAFYVCSGLTSVSIGNSVTSIGSIAFSGCSGLISVTIPNSVTNIGRNAFENTGWYNNQPDGVVYAGKIAYKYKGVMPANMNIILNEGTIGIAKFAFWGCSGLTSITIPNSVTSIGIEAFRNCSG